MAEYDHPYLARVHACRADPQASCVYVATELCNCNLADAMDEMRAMAMQEPGGIEGGNASVQVQTLLHPL
jgi:hypothetical protein